MPIAPSKLSRSKISSYCLLPELMLHLGGDEFLQFHSVIVFPFRSILRSPVTGECSRFGVIIVLGIGHIKFGRFPSCFVRQLCF